MPTEAQTLRGGWINVWRTHLDAGDLDHEHGGSEDMAGVVTPELNASHLLHLVEVDGLDLFHAVLQVGLRVQHVISWDVTADTIQTIKRQRF